MAMAAYTYALVLVISSLLLCAALAARPAPGSFDPLAQGGSLNKGRTDGQVRVVIGEDGVSLAADFSNAGSAPAVGTFSGSLSHKSDFAQLRIDSSGDFPDVIQMRAAGFAEGYLTAEMINDHWSNMQWWLSQNTESAPKLKAWLWDQDLWTRRQIQERKDAGSLDAFWVGMQYLTAQFDGMVEGYSARVAEAAAQKKLEGQQQQQQQQQQQLEAVDALGFLLLNSFGDMDDLVAMMELEEPSFNRAPGAKPLHSIWDTISPGKARARIAQRSHCSALVKVTHDLSDILMAHTTWWSYASMLRVFKHYKFELAHPVIKSQAQSFSSYPGTLSSIDDWYVLDTQMVVTETSNDIFNTSMYQLSTNQAALSWQRARVANMLADDGRSWAQYIGTHNSGTYNNQYMVVDLKRFQPYQELQPGLLTIVETLPGNFVWADTTQELERGYWPSYNIPYFPAVYNATGYNLLRNHLTARGPEFNEVVAGLKYQLSPRAKILRRDAGSVTDLESLKKLVRSNGWPSDVLSRSPWDAISARGDLSPDPDAKDANGAYDAKVTNYHLAMRMSSEVVNGPTWGNGLPPFSWADWPEVAHQGMRQVYNTEWELQQQ